MSKYDLMIKGGRVADFLTNRDGLYDVAVCGGEIELVAPDIPVKEAANVIRADGLAVLPGITDLHTHIASSALRTTTETPGGLPN
ncbi:MAG: hypothetical protein Q8P50_00160 [Bacillota bacterium]|nr:hypothetical protein [Bacillota bacterium]